MSEWISVEDKLPDSGDTVICTLKNNYVTEMEFAHVGGPFWYKHGFDGFIKTNPVTHWMPLPEPPKGE